MFKKYFSSLILMLVMSTVVFSNDSLSVSNLSIGNSLGAYKFFDLESKMILSDDLEYPLLISVFTTWCSVCKKELAHLNKTLEDGQTTINVLVVNAGEKQKQVKRYVRKRNLNLPVVLDRDLVFVKSLGIMGTPSVFVFDKEKKLIFQGNELPHEWGFL